MRFSTVAGALLSASLVAGHSSSPQEQGLFARANHSKLAGKRDASTVMSGGDNNEGEAHGAIVAPTGSTFTSIPVGTGGETVAAYWSADPENKHAQQAFIFMHGKLRDGDNYWTIMNNVLSSAVKANYDGASNSSIIVAPEFFSTIYNSGVSQE